MLASTVELTVQHEKRLLALEEFLPILKEHFAGKIAGADPVHMVETAKEPVPLERMATVDMPMTAEELNTNRDKMLGIDVNEAKDPVVERTIPRQVAGLTGDGTVEESVIDKPLADDRPNYMR